MAVDVTEVQKALKGVDYPASRADLVEHARGNNAPDEVISALENADQEEFEGPSGVMAAVQEDLGG
ncbi:MAG TPA: DUF2795 domain-containing protein [Solirubrobacteraceae bacterium]|nr:DUF2795 domain-containing protein [Solirubrobacteraceae bacterium]